MFGDGVSVVITSINPPREKLFDFIELGWNVIVVGDKKTPDSQWNQIDNTNLYFLSLDEQKSRYPQLSAAIGENTYARKNLGYLYATQIGSKVIFDTDDDTFLRIETKRLLSGELPLQHFRVKGKGWFNPYLQFATDSGLWPRGFPLSLVAQHRKHIDPGLVIDEINEEVDADIIQTLVNLEPDVDSIYRMTVMDEIL